MVVEVVAIVLGLTVQRRRSSLLWQSIRQLDLKVTAWMYWYSFLALLIRSSHIGVPSAK